MQEINESSRRAEPVGAGADESSRRAAPVESGRGESSRRATPASPEAEARGPVSPLRAFGILAILIAIVAGAGLIAVSNDDSDPEPRFSEGNNFALTDAEALERFRELDSRRLQAYEERDSSMIRLIVTSDSPLNDIARREIAKLRADNIFSRTTFFTTDLEVLSNTPQEIRIIQEVRQEPRFITESGKDVTASNETLIREILWVLRREHDEWKIFNSEVLSTQKEK